MSDQVFDFGDVLVRHLDAGSGWRLEVNSELTCVRAWEKSQSQQRINRQADQEQPGQRGHGQAREMAVQRRHTDIHRIADVNEFHIRLGYGNDQPEHVFFGKPRDRQHIGAGAGTRLNQGAEIREALRDHATERRVDFGIIKHYAIPLFLCLRARQLASCGLHRRFGSLQLCIRRHIFAFQRHPLPVARPYLACCPTRL